MLSSRTLVGHAANSTVLSVATAGLADPNLLLSSGSDGTARLWDLRAAPATSSVFKEGLVDPDVMSVCFHTTNAALFYAASGSSVSSFDTRNPSTPVSQSLGQSKDQINMLAANATGALVAAADDNGDIRIIDTTTRQNVKVISAHDNICTSVQFIKGRVWEVLTGGLDGHISLWDFSRGRNCLVDVDTASSASASSKQLINPPWVYSLNIADDGSSLAAGLGDGSVRLYSLASSVERKPAGKGGKKSSSKPNHVCNETARLDMAHSSEVCQTGFVGGPATVFSAGNDQHLILWKLSGGSQGAGDGCAYEKSSDVLHTSKPNWVCTNGLQLFVADQTSVISVYSITE